MSARQPPNQANRLEPQVYLKCQLSYQMHSQLLLSQKADTHSTIRWRVEHSVEKGGWLHTKMACVQTFIHPCSYLGPAWRNS